MMEYMSTSNRFTDKYARAFKLWTKWGNMYDKFERMLWRGYTQKTITMQCAWAVMVMMKTGIRVGNEKSAEGYVSINKWSEHFNKTIKTYGLTTLLKEHCYVRAGKLFMYFTGKKAVKQYFVIDDENLVLVYQHLTTGKKKTDRILDISHYDLTKFVKKSVGKNFTVKDFRTAVVNKIFVENIPKTITAFGEINRRVEINKLISMNFDLTAAMIGHTKSVCKTAYVSKNLVNFWRNELEEKLAENYT